MNQKTILYLLIILFLNCKLCISGNTGIVYTTFQTPYEDINDYGKVAGSWPTQNQYPRLVGDFDNDGNTDIIGFGAITSITYGNGSGYIVGNKEAVSSSFVYGSTDFAYTSFDEYPRLIGDVDGDGMDDIIGFETDGVYVSYSQGRGSSFTAKAKKYDGFKHPSWNSFNIYPRFAAYVDNDNMIDIVGFYDGGVHVIYGNGRNDFSVRDGTTVKLTNKFDVASGYLNQEDYPRQVADIDGDGLADLIGFGSSMVQVAFQKLDGTFENPVDLLSNNEFSYNAGFRGITPRMCFDVNGDGKADLLGFANSRIIIALSKGKEKATGAYDGISNDFVFTHGWPNQDEYPRTIGDVNGDGLLDVIGFDDRGVKIALGQKQRCNYQRSNTDRSRDIDNDCACKPTYFDQGDSLECGSCTSPCKNCYGSATNCTECINTTNRETDNTCRCSDGYYDEASYDCQLCPNSYKVAKCSDVLTITECKSGFERSLNTADCGCNPGYYDDGTNIDCVECKYPCINCTSDTICVGICQTPTNRNSAPTCGCMATFYDNDTECTSCTHPCENCNSETECTSCSNIPNRNQDSTCSCHARFYDDGSDCVPCNKPCDQCSSDTVCISCVGNFRKAVTLSLTSCECSDGYYDNNVDDDCQLCPNSYKVAKCSISSVIECKPGFQRSMDISTGCGCNDGYFDDGINIGCVKCDYPCINCSSQGVCVGTCETPSNRNSSPSCDCLDGYFENGTECEQCDHTLCVTCQNSAIECIQFCEEGCALCDNQNRCLQSKNKYFVVADGSVQKCDRQCLTCETQADNCLIHCDLSCALCNQQGSCQTCKIGDFLTSQNTCEVCHPKCYNCQNSNSQCTQCNLSGIGRSFDINTNCGCEEGYYEDGNNLDCKKCAPSSCSQCDNYGVCIQCQNQDFLPPLCKYSKIGNLIVVNQDQTIVNICQPRCYKCENSTDNCTECQLGQNRSQELPCKCLDGYHDNGYLSKDCILCPVNCILCENKQKCLKCGGSNLELNKFNNTCICKQGYKMNEISGKCEICFHLNGKCVSSCPSTTYPNIEKHMCEDKYYMPQQNLSVIWFGSGIFILIYVIMSIFMCKRFQKQSYLQGSKQSNKKGEEKNELK